MNYPCSFEQGRPLHRRHKNERGQETKIITTQETFASTLPTDWNTASRFNHIDFLSYTIKTQNQGRLCNCAVWAGSFIQLLTMNFNSQVLIEENYFLSIPKYLKSFKQTEILKILKHTLLFREKKSIKLGDWS